MLNDDWVSVPTGSEDSNNKALARNLFKDALFACEDERFEGMYSDNEPHFLRRSAPPAVFFSLLTSFISICFFFQSVVDMVIEAAKSTMRVLQPLADEIKDIAGTDIASRLFKVDKRALSVIHIKSISRIYGKQAHQILELLRKNPTGAIPVILKRIKQKVRATLYRSGICWCPVSTHIHSHSPSPYALRTGARVGESTQGDGCPVARQVYVELLQESRPAQSDFPCPGQKDDLLPSPSGPGQAAFPQRFLK